MKLPRKIVLGVFGQCLLSGGVAFVVAFGYLQDVEVAVGQGLLVFAGLLAIKLAWWKFVKLPQREAAPAYRRVPRPEYRSPRPSVRGYPAPQYQSLPPVVSSARAWTRAVNAQGQFVGYCPVSADGTLITEELSAKPPVGARLV